MIGGTDGGTGATLVVGTDSQLGRALHATLRSAGRTVVGTTRRKDRVDAGSIFLDLNDPFSTDLQLNGIQTAVICAAVTSIAECDRDPSGSAAVNVESTSRLAGRLLEAGVHTVFVSSNAVFDGSSPFPKATDETRPVSEYGRQKKIAEGRLLGLGGPLSIVRFSKILPADAPLFRRWVADLREGRVIEPLDDAYLAPLSLSYAVAVLARVSARGAQGLFQASASEDISYADAARHLARRVGAAMALVRPRPTASVGAPPFPRHTAMETTTLRALGFEAPPPYRALDDLDLPGAVATSPALMAADATAASNGRRLSSPDPATRSIAC